MADTKLSCPNMEEISNEEEISFNGRKIIETGLLLRLPKLRFGILFEELPIWLAALDHTFVENIIFPHIVLIINEIEPILAYIIAHAMPTSVNF